VDDIVVPVRSSMKKEYPRCSFTRGITNLSLLTADERAGVAFVLALVAASKPGSDMLKKASKRIKKARKRGQKVNAEIDENGNPILGVDDEGEDDNEVVYAESLCKPAKMLYMLELILAFHAWYKKGHPFSLKTEKEKSEVLGAIRIMLESIKKFAPRQDRNGWKLQKFHDILHVVRDMFNFGSPNNFDAAPNENNLIDFAKKPGRRAHKKKEVFVSQVSKRLRETDLIQKAFYALTRSIQSNDGEFQESIDMDCFESNIDHEDILDNSSDVIESKLIGGPLFCVNLLPETEHQQIVQCLAGKSVRTRHQLHLHPLNLNFLHKQRLKNDYPLQGQTIIELWTEYK